MKQHASPRANSRTLAITIITASAFVLAGCVGRKDQPELEEVRVQLGWYHQAQWAGFYAAEINGYYKAKGLAVKLVPRPKPSTNVISLVSSGSADFGTTNGVGIIQARADEVAITAISAIYRRDPAVFMTLAEKDIRQPKDFPGRTLRAMNLVGNGAVFRAMMGHLELDPNSVTEVDAGYDLTPFFEGRIDIWPGFLTDEVLTARELGYELNIILPEYYGVHLYGMVLFARDDLIQNKPDLVVRFLAATLEGWRWAIENPDEAAGMALVYNPSLDEMHELRLMEATLPLIHTGEDQIGWMRRDVWFQTYELLRGQNVLRKELDIEEVYTTKFIEMIYGAPL